jgi:signal transduction histidine kinase/ActR/RegA family two-component response regulator
MSAVPRRFWTRVAATVERLSERILILAPIGRDASASASVLQQMDLPALTCANFDELERALEEGAGAAIITEEAFFRSPYEGLVSWIARQPPWSDFPLIILTSSRGVSPQFHAAGLMTALRNVSLLERPLQTVTLLSTVQACLRARRRQYELRGHLLERERTAAELERLVTERTRELQEANARLQVEMAEREQAEAALRQTQKMEAIGQMTGGIAHDFNNLLTAALGNIELAMARAEDPRTLQLLKNATQAAERGAKLTNQLLAFARKQQLKLAPVDLNRLVSDMGELLFRTIGATIRIDTVLQDELWPAIADPTQVELVILNLALNARDAMPSGGRLTVATANVDMNSAPAHGVDLPCEDFVAISVSDSGTGMTEEVLAKAFEPFFTTKALGAGTGLGLSQVYGVARQSGGGVRIESRLGHGTTVWVYFPRAKSAPLSRPAEQTKHLVASGEGRILVVDDDADVRRFVSVVLAGLGYGVLEAGSAREAWDLLDRGEQPDLVLIDYAMPEVNGADFAKALRQRHSAFSNLLFMTGYADTEKLTEQAAPELVLKKPFTASELAAAIGAALERSEAPTDNVISLKPKRG